MEAVLERPVVTAQPAPAPASAPAPAQKPASTQAQINVRLDRELKESGDRELELLGVTPSQAVRALWGKLARGGQDAAAVRELLFEQAPAKEMSDAQKRKLEVLEEIKQSWQDLADTLGLDLSTFEPSTDEELREARYDYLREKWGEL